MKLRLFIMFALFPFLHATSYSAKLVSCSQDQIVLKSQDSEFRVSLFNTKITKEEGWQKTCELLEDATSIRFEIDPSSKIEEPVPVYLFADDKLVQEELMKQGHAYPMIRNPEYTYEKRLESAYDATQTMAKPAEVKTKSRPALVGPLYFGAYCSGCSCCCICCTGAKRSSGLWKKNRQRPKQGKFLRFYIHRCAVLYYNERRKRGNRTWMLSFIYSLSAWSFIL